MWQTVELPLWFFVLIVLFAAVTFASHFLFPSVRWFFRRRLERAVARLNERLTVPIEPFKLARRHDMIQRLIYDPEVSQAIVVHAKENDVREDVAFQMARRYAREIVPSFSAFAYFGFGIRAARWLANSLYTVHTATQNTAHLKDIPSDATVVFVMNHRSNMDYVLVTYLAARASALSYAVGEWARVWPLSRLIKSMGAYFIRRKSRGQLYRKVLARYVQLATEGGVTQAIFPEGGLSVDGTLKPFKMGLLSYVIDAYDPEGRDIVFVPVAINYDRVLEDRVLIAAHQRGDRRFPARISVVMGFALKMFWKRIRGKHMGFGAASVSFGQPLSLRAQPDVGAVELLAAELKERVERSMPVFGVPLLAHLFLHAQGPLSKAALMEEAEALFRLTIGTRPRVSRDSFPGFVNAALKRMHTRGMIIKDDDHWVMVAAEQPLLQYYANSIRIAPDVENAATAKS
ncbi:1-acyl-sn-glycerol-3-phosphate acyltransferase [uncultured Tateyamaria sp.]|uniref:1-acyl-sn-glycerol-3-phosphate acyltransferase n=1 Tax=Tateyamaria sp. 1078 TaxID=3417464 RepID=UPI0026068BCB|nr:1-acyl-sn-glycerol-3-phosphate acyltransferase [uncultured Tateyamaria sp.]